MRLILRGVAFSKVIVQPCMWNHLIGLLELYQNIDLQSLCMPIRYAMKKPRLSRRREKFWPVQLERPAPPGSQALASVICGTSDLCLVMDGQAGTRIFQGYADADWGGDLDTCRSMTNYILQDTVQQPVGSHAFNKQSPYQRWTPSFKPLRTQLAMPSGKKGC